MFGILYSLVMGCIYGIGNIKENIDQAESKRKNYNRETDTYIDHRGCTRDYKTDEPRLVTSQWNKEKRRYEQIVLRNGKIIRNIEEEKDILKEAADWKIKIYPNDNDYSKHEFRRNDGSSGMVKGILYKTKMDNEIVVKREFRIHNSPDNVEKIVAWFMPCKYKVMKIESASVGDYCWKDRIKLINNSIIKDGKELNGKDGKTQYDNWYNAGGDIWLYERENDNNEENIVAIENLEDYKTRLKRENDKRLEESIMRRMW